MLQNPPPKPWSERLPGGSATVGNGSIWTQRLLARPRNAPKCKENEGFCTILASGSTKIQHLEKATFAKPQFLLVQMKLESLRHWKIQHLEKVTFAKLQFSLVQMKLKTLKH